MLGNSAIKEAECRHLIKNTQCAFVEEYKGCSPTERLQQFSIRGIKEAADDAGIALDRSNLRMVLGTSYGVAVDQGPERSLHQWTQPLKQEFRLSHEPVSISTACASGVDVIATGVDLLRSGSADVCLCGAADVLTDAKRAVHSMLGTVSPTELRPYDVRHGGTVLGEGAAFFVLEFAEHARSRGATIYALVAGIGSANDSGSLTAPDPQGHALQLAILQSLTDAGLQPEDVGIVCSHGSGTSFNDLAESRALAKVFGPASQPYIYSTKGHFGHALGATAGIELLSLILALRHQVVPPIVGLVQPIDEAPAGLVHGSPAPCAAEYGLKLSLGFGGFNTAIIVGRP